MDQLMEEEESANSEQLDSDDEELPDYPYIQITKINPKSIDINALFGHLNNLTNEWRDGVFT